MGKIELHKRNYKNCKENNLSETDLREISK